MLSTLRITKQLSAFIPCSPSSASNAPHIYFIPFSRPPPISPHCPSKPLHDVVFLLLLSSLFILTPQVNHQPSHHCFYPRGASDPLEPFLTDFNLPLSVCPSEPFCSKLHSFSRFLTFPFDLVVLHPAGRPVAVHASLPLCTHKHTQTQTPNIKETGERDEATEIVPTFTV